MRNISKLALSLTLLATQVNVPQLSFGNVAAAAGDSKPTAGVYEVKLNTTSASAVEIVVPKKPDFDAEVLAPLRAAQAEAAKKAAEVEARAKAAAAAAAHRAALAKQAAAVAAQAIPGSHTDWMRAAGIAEADFGYVEFIIDRESGWGVTKSNYGGSGAYGLGQALPASKMAKFGDDYLTNPITQLKWANAYAIGCYGSWAGAYSHWLARHSW